MKSISQKLIVTSFILALLAAIAAFIYLQSLKTPKETIKKVAILVAVDNIPARTLIDKKMIRELEVTDSMIFNNYIRDSSKIVGKYTKETILKNEGFLNEKLINENSSDLSSKIDKDHRAITINVTGASGVANLVKPADFVDIIVYLSEKRDGQKVIRPDLSKIILQNIEILAVDTQLNREDTSKDKTAEKQKTPATFLVTLSVPLKDLEKVMLAESIGSLKLALRPLKTDETNETNGTISEDLILDMNLDNRESSADQTSSGANSKIEENKVTSSVKNNGDFTNYTVKRGDTLRKISRSFYGDPSKYTILKEANKIENENIILPGEIIKIPVNK